jgi:hypothetical protein
MNPNKIKLENISKLFEYEKISREIDSCNDADQLKNIAKSYVKLFLKQEETIISLNLNPQI